MSAMTDASTVLESTLPGFDEDLLQYLISLLDDMTIEEKRSPGTLSESIGPFLLESNYTETDEGVEELCRSISVAFGGSGYKSKAVKVEDETPALLAAPVKIKENTEYGDFIKEKKQTYGGVVLDTGENTVAGVPGAAATTNSMFDVSNIATNVKQLRKQRRENDALQRAAKAEQLRRAEELAEQARARMAAIRASRSLGRQQFTGVNIDCFSLSHPAGSGDLLTDAALTMAPGRRYGLIGRNGAGKNM